MSYFCDFFHFRGQENIWSTFEKSCQPPVGCFIWTKSHLVGPFSGFLRLPAVFEACKMHTDTIEAVLGPPWCLTAKFSEKFSLDPNPGRIKDNRLRRFSGGKCEFLRDCRFWSNFIATRGTTEQMVGFNFLLYSKGRRSPMSWSFKGRN